MFDTENILGQLVVADMKKLAADGSHRGTYFDNQAQPQSAPVASMDATGGSAAPSFSPAVNRGVPRAPVVHPSTSVRRASDANIAFKKREEAYYRQATNAEPAIMARRKALAKANEGAVNYRKSLAASKARKADPNAPAAGVGTGKMTPGSSSGLDRNTPEYRDRLKQVYTDFAANNPTFKNVAGNPATNVAAPNWTGGQVAAAPAAPTATVAATPAAAAPAAALRGRPVTPSTKVAHTLLEIVNRIKTAQDVQAPAWSENPNLDTQAANADVNRSAEHTDKLTAEYDPPIGGGSGTGMTPGSAASGVTSGITSTPPGMTTTSTLATPPAPLPAGAPNPKMPTSGPSPAQGSTARGPTSTSQSNAGWNA